MMLVALRKESVDRNNGRFRTVNNAKIVALRKESVDRNIHLVLLYRQKLTSLSARRAWIEITSQVPTWFGMPSLSARRAWIEITSQVPTWFGMPRVALRKESVDRNIAWARPSRAANCRSPQGERG